MKPQQEKQEIAAEAVVADSSDLDHERKMVLLFKTDPKEFDRIVKKFYPGILGYLRRLTRDEELAKDLTQKTFIKAFSGLLKFEWQGISVTAYLYRIAQNEFKQWFNTKKRARELKTAIVSHDRDTSDSADNNILRENAAAVLDSCLATLNPKFQKIIDLFYWRELRTWEIAIVLSMPESTVKSHLQRGREALKLEMVNRKLDMSSFCGLLKSDNGATEKEFNSGAVVKMSKEGNGYE